VLALLAGVVISARSATAQVTTATLYGVVTDESGAAVPGSTATMRHEATGTVSTKITDASHSRDYSEVDWAFLAGVSSYLSGEINLGVLRNTTGIPRTGVIVVGETRWTVKQDR